MFTYKELSRVAQKYYPKEKGYCAVIAVSVAAQVPFGKARSLLHKQGRKQGKGTRPTWTYLSLLALGYTTLPLSPLHHEWVWLVLPLHPGWAIHESPLQTAIYRCGILPGATTSCVKKCIILHRGDYLNRGL